MMWTRPVTHTIYSVLRATTSIVITAEHPKRFDIGLGADLNDSVGRVPHKTAQITASR